jgi:DNA-binding SARP family transcriptional activator
MPQSSPQAYRNGSSATVVERSTLPSGSASPDESRRLANRKQTARSNPWDAARLRVARRRPTAVAEPTDAVARWAPQPESAWLRDEVVAEVRSLTNQMRTLQERYEEEHRRLTDSLEFLMVQSRDLERELLAFGRLAERVETGFLEAGATRGTVSSVSPTSLLGEGTRCLEVRCLGGFEVRYQGRRIDLGTSRNGRLIFKYLAARAPSRRASKELLAEIFWPEVSVERGLASLQSAVHQVKRAMGQCDPELLMTPAIVYGDDHYAINPEFEVRCDVDAFRSHLKDASALEARGLAEGAYQAYWLAHETYCGEFLPEERYEDWVAAERTSLEAEQVRVLGRLLEVNLEKGAYLEALNFGRRLLELDPSREDVHRDLMRCYSRLGQRSEALRQYRRCFEVLQNELDLLPEAETTALFEQVVGGQVV